MLAKSSIVALALTTLTMSNAVATTITPFSSASGTALPEPWRVTPVPTATRQTRYSLQRIDGRNVVKAEAEASSANALHPLRADVSATPVLRFSWRVDRFPTNSDLLTTGGDDIAAKVCVLFDLPLNRLSFGDRLYIEMWRRVFDPQLPAATLCYVWDRTLARGTWLPNAYSDRVRMLVLRSAAAGDRGEWFDERRDLKTDFARAFSNEASGGLPPALAIVIATDADDTGSSALAYFGDVTLSAE